MKLMNWHKLTLAAASFAWTGVLTTSALAATATVSFQNGINGYTSTFDRKIDERPDPAAPAAPLTYNGSTQTQYFLDGYNPANGSPDGQALIRFDNIIGNGPGQIPAGATILSAQFQVVTSTSGNAQSAGPWGVAQLLGPFDSNTTYFGSYNCGGCALTSRGPWFEDGYTERPLAGFGSNWQGQVTSNDITKMVQSWASGTTNHGLVIQTGNPAGTDDGWGVLSTGHPLPERRPKLTVTYTTNSMTTSTFQRGLNGYAGDTMAFVRSGNNIVGTTTESDAGKDDITYDGLTGTYTVAANSTIAAPTNLTNFQVFLDGPQFEAPTGVANSADDLGLIKFGSVFGNGANQAPTNVPVAKAWLEITTGTTNAAAMSNGEWSVHRVLRSWDTTTLYSSPSFGSIPGLQQSDGDIGPALDTQEGIIYGSQVRFDVTSYLEGLRNGSIATDNGLAILSSSTADGWQIHLNGSTDPEWRPKLHVISGILPVVNPGLPGDFNGDGNVNAADYTTWRDNLGGTHNLNGNGDETGGSGGLVDQADYNLWKANFGNSGAGGSLGSSAVPEPSMLALLATAVMGLVCTSRRK